jgi:hypothetical protein
LQPMRSCSTRNSLGRSTAQIALLPAAAFLVHQLRYLLAFGGHAGAVLQETGHSYLNSVVPWLVLLIACVVGGFLRSLGRSLAGQTTVPRYTLSLAGLWIACSSALIAIFVGQELLEGIFLAGHPAGWTGVFGYGGWWAIPSAALVGLILASLLHGALWVLREAARLGARVRHRPRRSGSARRLPLDVFLAPLAPLVGGWSGRGPPVAAGR